MSESTEQEPHLPQEAIVIAGEKLRPDSFTPISGEAVAITTLDKTDGKAEVLGTAVLDDSGVRVQIIGLSNGELGLVPAGDEEAEETTEGQVELLSPDELNEQTRKTLKGAGRGLLAAIAARFVGQREQAYKAQGDRTSPDPSQPKKGGLTPVTEIDPTGEKPQRVVAYFKNNPDSLPNQQ